MAYAVTNPATGETVKTFDTITDAELQAAIAAADEAHRTWSKSTTVAERAGLIRRVAELHTERRQQLADLIVREMGNNWDDTDYREVGPQVLIGYGWVWDSGFSTQMAIGGGRNLADNHDEYDDGSEPFINGYFRMGYAF